MLHNFCFYQCVVMQFVDLADFREAHRSAELEEYILVTTTALFAFMGKQRPNRITWKVSVSGCDLRY